MALYVDVRVNDEVVASAAVCNTTFEGDVCNYVGGAITKPFDERGVMRHTLDVRAHNRRVSVWRLVAKIADDLAKKEGA